MVRDGLGEWTRTPDAAHATAVRWRRTQSERSETANQIIRELKRTKADSLRLYYNEEDTVCFLVLEYVLRPG